jgi:2-amino-1-hydroxyethylphosphonate dioxygenase (glycine-forming)
VRLFFLYKFSIMSLSVLKPEAIVNEVFTRYEKYFKRKSTDQPISQFELASRAAAIAEEEGFEDEVVLAAFFHDIGYTCTGNEGGGPIGQEKLGADYLRKQGFSERLAILVESDAMAKRYLAYKYPDYYIQLSDDDKAKFELQGGPMNREEAEKFEQDPDAESFVRLRRLNDKARNAIRSKFDLSHIKLLATAHLYKIVDQYLPAFLMPKTRIQGSGR